ncbi:MAG: polyamine aminopropyltransferase [Methylophilaceae bacterium]
MFRLGPRKFARSIHRSVAEDSSVDVSESDGVRSLHLGTDTIQSSMRIKTPFELELTYTRGMMAFLLFSSQVKQVLAIGLGGGSVPKYIHHYLPEITTRVVEINPQIINIARSHFHVPEDDEKLQVIEGDGIVYLQENQTSTQVLMIDAFDSKGIPSDMCTQDFFDSCAGVLTNEGMMAINLWGSDRNFDVYLQRIEQSFHQRVLMLPTGRPGNIVVFGFRRVPADLRWARLRERAKMLESNHKIEFLEFVEKLRDHNANTNNRLLLESDIAS